MEISRIASLGFRAYVAHAKRKIYQLLEYRTSLLVWIPVGLAWAFVFVLVWQFIYSHTETLYGWSLTETMLMLGYFGVAKTIMDTFFNYGKLSQDIVLGFLDIYLTKPMPTIVATLGTQLSLPSVLEIVPALVYFTFALPSIKIGPFLIGLIYTLLGTVIVALILLNIVLLSFWFGRAIRLLRTFQNVIISQSKFPTAIYPTFWKIVFYFLIPVGVIQCVPVELARNLSNSVIYLPLLLIAIIFWSIVTWITWKKGLMRYESAGG